MPLDLDRIRELGAQRAQAQADADQALSDAFDALEAVVRAGERVNLKQFAEVLGVERRTVYNVLERRNVDLWRAS